MDAGGGVGGGTAAYWFDADAAHTHMHGLLGTTTSTNSSTNSSTTSSTFTGAQQGRCATIQLSPLFCGEGKPQRRASGSSSSSGSAQGSMQCGLVQFFTSLSSLARLPLLLRQCVDQMCRQLQVQGSAGLSTLQVIRRSAVLCLPSPAGVYMLCCACRAPLVCTCCAARVTLRTVLLCTITIDTTCLFS